MRDVLNRMGYRLARVRKGTPTGTGRDKSIFNGDEQSQIQGCMGGSGAFDATTQRWAVEYAIARAPDDAVDEKFVFGSYHPNGTNFTMGDGAVRFIRSDTPIVTLHRLSVRNDGQPVTLD